LLIQTVIVYVLLDILEINVLTKINALHYRMGISAKTMGL